MNFYLKLTFYFLFIIITSFSHSY